MVIELQYPEGATQIDTDEALELIPSLSTQSELNAFEAQNILDAIFWAKRSRIIKSSLLDQDTLKRLHKEMFGKTWRWAGSYRTSQKNIGCEACSISSEMKTFQEDMTAWLAHKSFSPQEVAAKFHHRLVWIHPFANGNGRLARLAADLLSEQQGWATPTWGSSNLIEVNDIRRNYIQSLRAADQHDFAKLISFMYN